MDRLVVGRLPLIGLLVSSGASQTWDEAVSHLPILAPIWAQLKSDLEPYKRPSPMREVPQVIPLDDGATCLCVKGSVTVPSLRTPYDAVKPTFERDCTVYTLLGSCQTKIQLQSCGRCDPKSRRYVGPDGRDLGVFNYNNSVLFTHELLDEYSAAFTASETPFVAWVTTVQRRYSGTSSAFVSEDTVRSAWFAYVRLQIFENDMTCDHCGPFPDTVIWDGVTLAYSKKHLLDTLEPPTTTHMYSECRPEITYHSKQQCIPKPEIRKRIRGALKPKFKRDDEDDEDEDENDRVTKEKKQQQKNKRSEDQALQVQQRLEEVECDLRGVNGAVARVFKQYCMSLNRKDPMLCQRFRELFLEVRLWRAQKGCGAD